VKFYFLTDTCTLFNAVSTARFISMVIKDDVVDIQSVNR